MMKRNLLYVPVARTGCDDAMRWWRGGPLGRSPFECSHRKGLCRNEAPPKPGARYPFENLRAFRDLRHRWLFRRDVRGGRPPAGIHAASRRADRRALALGAARTPDRGGACAPRARHHAQRVRRRRWHREDLSLRHHPARDLRRRLASHRAWPQAACSCPEPLSRGHLRGEEDPAGGRRPRGAHRIPPRATSHRAKG